MLRDIIIPPSKVFGYAWLINSSKSGPPKEKVWLQLYPRVMWESEWLKLCERKPNGQIHKIWYSDSHVSGNSWDTEETMEGKNIGLVHVLDCFVSGN